MAISASSIFFTLLACYVIHQTVWNHMCHRSLYFASLPRDLQRHGSNFVSRVLLGVPTSICSVGLIIALFYFERGVWLTQPLFGQTISTVGGVHVAMNIYDLSQRRRHQWDVFWHHTLETIVFLAFFEVFSDGLLEGGVPEPSFVILAILGLVGRLSNLPFGYQMLFDKKAMTLAQQRRIALLYTASFFLFMAIELVHIALSIAYYAMYGSEIPLGIAVPYWIAAVLFPLIDMPLKTLLYRKSSLYVNHTPVTHKAQKDDLESFGLQGEGPTLSPQNKVSVL